MPACGFRAHWTPQAPKLCAVGYPCPEQLVKCVRSGGTGNSSHHPYHGSEPYRRADLQRCSSARFVVSLVMEPVSAAMGAVWPVSLTREAARVPWWLSSANGRHRASLRAARTGHSRLTAGHRCPRPMVARAIHWARAPGEEGSSPGAPSSVAVMERQRRGSTFGQQ